jgi:crossover junction endodeoxyribonuclease RusA
MSDLLIELGWPAKALSPNARDHFMTVSRFKKASKDTAYWATKAVIGHATFPHDGKSPVPFVITAYPPDKRSRDDDNLIAQTKSARDGIAMALGIDDKFFATRVQWAEPVRNGKVVIRIAEAA